MSGEREKHEKFVQYIEKLTDAEALQLHRIVSRRAAAIYGPMFKGNWETGVAASRSKRGT